MHISLKNYYCYYPPVRGRLLISSYSTLILHLYLFVELPESLKSVPYTQGFYVARYFYLAYNKANTFIYAKKDHFL